MWRGHKRAVNRVVAGKSGNVYSCSRDLTLCAWRRGAQEPLRRFEGHELTVSAVAVDDDDPYTDLIAVAPNTATLRTVRTLSTSLQRQRAQSDVPAPRKSKIELDAIVGQGIRRVKSTNTDRRSPEAEDAAKNSLRCSDGSDATSRRVKRQPSLRYMYTDSLDSLTPEAPEAKILTLASGRRVACL